MKKNLNGLNKALVCTDPRYGQILKLLLEEIGIRQVHFVEELKLAKPAYQRLRPDLCLLDAGLSPAPAEVLALAKSIKGDNCEVPIVFMISDFKSPLAKQVRSLPCCTVMAKEVSRRSLLKTLEYAMLQKENQQLTKSLASSINKTQTPPFEYGKKAPPLFFKVGDKFRRIKMQQIDFFFADNKMTFARVGQRNFPTSVQLKALEASLKPSFLRCHKKYLVNIDKIESILIKDDKVLVENEVLPIGYVYRKPFFEGLNLIR